MKFHVVLTPCPRRLSSNISTEFRSSCLEINKELQNTLRKLLKKNPDAHYPKIVCIFDDKSVVDLVGNIHAGDEIVVHAEGWPFAMGPNEEVPIEYSLRPLQFAALLHSSNLPDIDVNISLLACNSGTEFYGSNFAKDLSLGLNHFNYQQIKVTGYMGYIDVKSNAKFSVSSVFGRGTKGTHSNLESARIVYTNCGFESFAGRALVTSMTDFGFDWASCHIGKLLEERQFISDSKLHLRAEERPVCTLGLSGET